VVPGFAGTSVFFEQIGFPEDMRRRAIAEIADAAAREASAAAFNAIFSAPGTE